MILNGQIMPGDIDRFALKLAKGQRIVMAVSARELIPYLADAVPGWFQATLALYDDQGKEVAYADDYRFNPDPVIFYEIPQDGQYVLEIKDAIYRGREDFVYRIAVGEFPYVTSIFPLGARLGDQARRHVDGIPGHDTDIQYVSAHLELTGKSGTGNHHTGNVHMTHCRMVCLCVRRYF